MEKHHAMLLTLLVTSACTDATAPAAPASQFARADVARAEVAAGRGIKAARGVYTIEAYIDGRSIFQFAAPPIFLMQWHHLDFAAPGRLGGANLPTRINKRDWYPDWPPNEPSPELRDCYCFSRPVSSGILFVGGVYGQTLVRSRGSTTVRDLGTNIEVEFNDNAFPGADWYKVRLDLRRPVTVVPWPRRTPYVVSLSRDRFVTVALLDDADFDPGNVGGISLGDDRRLDTPIAIGVSGAPLTELRGVDLVMSFAVSELQANGDIARGTRVLQLVAPSRLHYGYLRGEVRVTFVP